MAKAQIPIGLKAAIDTALKNNLSVKNEQLKAQYQQLLIKTAVALPKTSITAEAGQINSIYTDTKFGLAQSFSMPQLYTRQKELLQQEWKSSLLNVSVREALLKKQVAQVFYHMRYAEQKKALLQYIDSLYTSFYKKAALRLAKGESNVLEKASAETQLGQINIQLHQLQQDLAILQEQFRLLLGTDDGYVPAADSYRMALTVLSDSSSLATHITIQSIQQQQQIAAAGIRLEKSRLLPDFSIGYSNASIKGTGADNKVYGAGNRFSAVQLGIGIPVFARAQKEKINSAKFARQIAENNYAMGLKTLQTDYQSALAEYNKYLQAVQYFETSGLKNAALISATANQQLANGSINYLEWVQVINQAVTVKSDYIESVKHLNDAVILLHYFTNK